MTNRLRSCVALSLLLVLACAKKPEPPRTPAGFENAARAFMSRFELSIFSGRWKDVEKAFAKDAELVLISPPPARRVIPVSRELLIEALKREVSWTDYERSRQVKVVDVSQPDRTIVLSEIRARFHDVDGTYRWHTFSETTKVDLTSDPRVITSYRAQISREPGG